MTAQWVLGLTLFSMAVGLFISLLFFRRIYAPIEYLDQAINQVEAGNFSVRMECRGEDEIAHYAQSFNRMLDLLEKMAIEERRVEVQLHHAEKLAVAGELAAGTAHEIRNPLTVVKGYTQLLSTKLEGTDNQEHIKIILSEIARMERIIQNFMLLAKPPQIWDAVNINYLVNEVWLLENYQVGVVQPEFILAEEELLVRGDPSQLKQVLLNIVNNALQAMKERGTLTFMTWKEDRNIFISIRDTGMGISPEYLEKIGQPFFTTKEDGTGLGLMVSYRIVQYHGGDISVESKVGQGTVFTLSFPMF